VFDIVLLTNTNQELVTRVYGAARDTGMMINVRKAEVMNVCEGAPPMSTMVNGESISEISSLKYLKYLGARFIDETLYDEDT